MRIGEFEAAVRAADPDAEPDTFTLQGEEFTVADSPNIIALGRFAQAARAGADTDDMGSLAALIDTVASCVIEADEERFLNCASKHRVDPELLLKIVGAVLEAQAGRPTVQPSDSSAGLPTTTGNSKVPSSWRDTPFGRRELAAAPEEYADVLPVKGAAKLVLAAVS